MENLFAQFKSITAAEWKAQLIKDLKDVPFEELVWHNENGFDLKPFYTGEDVNTTYAPVFSHTAWHVAVRPLLASDEELNKQLLNNLAGGADAICIDLKNRNLEVLFKDIRLDFIHTTVVASATELMSFVNYVEKFYPNQKLSVSALPREFSAATELEAFLKAGSKLANHNAFLYGADVLHWHNQNCSAAIEIALVYLQLVEYAQLDNLPNAAPVIRVGVSADYFVQMAKLRAIRRLWELFKPEFNTADLPFIIAETSLTNKTLSDRYNNLLRSTVEAMAAVAGGCNALVVHPFDVLFGNSSSLPERMAINQQHILREESYFDKVSDLACGSYYVEHLTDRLADSALQIFKTIEQKGGYFAALNSGELNHLVAASANVAEQNLHQGKQIVIGVNKFKNEKEQVPVSRDVLSYINSLGINNPALSFELQHFYSNTHA